MAAAAPEARLHFACQADGGSRKEELAEQIEPHSLSSFLIVGFRSCGQRVVSVFAGCKNAEVIDV